jgi:alpha-beta hydrolase superfamily lysophospholipase
VNSIRTEFPGSQGTPLAARLDLPASAPRAWALFAHCFTCSKDTKAAAYIARALADAGFGVLRFDFTGLGGSGGDFANTDFSSNVDDLVAAADWLRNRHGAPALLLGHSLGGAAVLAAAHRIADARAVATLGAPFDPGHVAHRFGEHLSVIRSEGEATVTLAGRPFTIRRSFLDDLNGQVQAERIRGLRRPLMVMHSPQDAVVDIDNAAGIFKAALHPKSFVSLDGADHLLDREADARFAAGVIAAWASRYLPAAAAESAAAQGHAETV